MEVSALTYPTSISRYGRSPLLRLQSDEHLIKLIRAGQDAAFEALVSRYEARLLAFCRHLLGSREDAEDVLQDAFSASYNAILADERAINVRPWLYRIARNRCLNHLRRTPAVGVDSMDVLYAEHGETTADKVSRREEFRLLVGDIHELPETQRTALILREMDALSYEQIAEAMETTVSSVKSLLVRARVSLAEAAEARLLSCLDVRTELGEIAEGLVRKPDALVRRHLKTCDRCSAFHKQLKRTNRALTALLPVGPLAFLHLTGSAGHGAAAATGSTGAGAAGAAGGTLGGGAATSGSGFVSAGIGALATKTAAGLAAAAMLTAAGVAAETGGPTRLHHATVSGVAAETARSQLAKGNAMGDAAAGSPGGAGRRHAGHLTRSQTAARASGVTARPLAASPLAAGVRAPTHRAAVRSHTVGTPTGTATPSSGAGATATKTGTGRGVVISGAGGSQPSSASSPLSSLSGVLPAIPGLPRSPSSGPAGGSSTPPAPTSPAGSAPSGSPPASGGTSSTSHPVADAVTTLLNRLPR